MPSWDELELSVGEASPMEARVFARLPLAAADRGDGDDLQLGGRLVGPECELARTLQTSVPFVARAAEGALMAQAVVVDPCFWTPELPFLYRAKLELRRKGQVVGRHEQVLGLSRKSSDA